MTDFSVRSDSVDVEQIMAQIRARIREKRGVDYTEEEIHRIAGVKLEQFLDSRSVRSGLLEEFRRRRSGPQAFENYAFEDSTLYESHRPVVRLVRRLLNPVLKLFINPQPVAQVLHMQARINEQLIGKEELEYEVMGNLVVELTRLGIEVKNLKMHVESLSARLDFDERRARALEGAVQYRPGALAPAVPAEGEEAEGAGAEDGEADAQAKSARRRRRRRGRRRGPGQLPATAAPGGEAGAPSDGSALAGGTAGDAGEPGPGGPAPARAEDPSNQ